MLMHQGGERAIATAAQYLERVSGSLDYKLASVSDEDIQDSVRVIC